MSAINHSAKSFVEKFLSDNDKKLRQYSASLASRDTGEFFDEGDFFNAMSMKIYIQAMMTNGFTEMPFQYIMKVAWNEGLMMLRKQRSYKMNVINFRYDDESSGAEVFDRFPVPDEVEPEKQYSVSEANELLQVAIASLPLQSQRVCTMLYAGKRPVEIAREMGFRSRATVNYHIDRIREVFTQYGVQPV